MNRSEIIKKIRKKTGRSQEKFAHKLGVSCATVSRWERGENQISDGHWKLVRLVFPEESEEYHDLT